MERHWRLGNWILGGHERPARVFAVAGRAMRPRSADSCRKIYRQAEKVAKERGGDGIADLGSQMADQRRSPLFPTSMFNVGCSMFDVHFPSSFFPNTDQVAALTANERGEEEGSWIVDAASSKRGMGGPPVSSCGWDILSQAVHGASRSMF